MDTTDPAALVASLIQTMKAWETSASKAISGIDVSSEAYGQKTSSLLEHYAEIVSRYCTPDACTDESRTRHVFMLSEPSSYESERVISTRLQRGKLGAMAVVHVDEETLVDIGDHIEYRLQLVEGFYRVYDKKQVPSDGARPIVVQI